MVDLRFTSGGMKMLNFVREFRRVQVDMSGNKKVLLVQEYDADGTPMFIYSEEGKPDYVLHTDNGKLNYLQFLRA